MIAASPAWKDVQQRFLLPEQYIEIKCAITETGVNERASASGTSEAFFSDVGSVLDTSKTIKRYATGELNFWSLDGKMDIMPDTDVFHGGGYVSDISESGSVTLTLPEVHTVPLPGVTITFGNGEYAPVFTVTAKNGNTVVAETTVTGNTKSVCIVDLEIANYDNVTVTVHNWCVPYHRARIEELALGHMLTLGKTDIISYTHEQYGDLLSGEIPKYSIEFTIDNSSGRWDPNNPQGMEKYLAERQKLTVRYGLDIDGEIEWINGGTFYLSEWYTPSNGFEARFVARDVFEFLLSPQLEGGSVYGNFAHLITSATSAFLPDDTKVTVDASLSSSAGRTAPAGTAAEWVQKCANGGCSIIRYDRNGNLYIGRLDKTLSEYRVPLSLSYSHPEISLSKPLKDVTADYSFVEIQRDPETNAIISRDTITETYKLSVGTSGETQTVSNDFLKSEEEARAVAEWVGGILKNRKTISGEFRADPRLDLYDVVTVESKYGALTPVVITNVKYIFNGSFRGSYTGRVLEEE